MKKLHSLLVLALFAVFASCSKSSSNNNNTNPATSFVINGVADVNMPDSIVAQTLAIGTGTGAQEKVTISLTGLPAGITANINPNNGTPAFSSVITYTANNAVLGTYPIKLKGTTASGATKEYSFNLNYSDCAHLLVGDYGVTDACGGTPLQYKINISKATGISNRIMLNNYPDQGHSVYADVNCDTKTFIIPTQPAGFTTVSGSGTINRDSTLTIRYTQVSGSVTNNCTSTIVSTRATACSSDLVRAYTYTSSCGTGGNIFVDGNSNVIGRITFENFLGTGMDVVADVNCATNTLTIPLQTGFNGFTFQGTGTFTSGHQIALSFTMKSGSNTQSCTAQFQ